MVAIRGKQQRGGARCTLGTKTPGIGREPRLPTMEFKALDLDVQVKDDHRKLPDRKVGDIWIVAVYI